jgi:hypothetical protein
MRLVEREDRWMFARPFWDEQKRLDARGWLTGVCNLPPQKCPRVGFMDDPKIEGTPAANVGQWSHHPLHIRDDQSALDGPVRKRPTIGLSRGSDNNGVETCGQ